MLEIQIKGEPKEIAALVLELQERQVLTTDANLRDGIIQCLQALRAQGEQEAPR